MQRHRTDTRTGLTLIELIVVLVVLVGLAGIIIPMLPNMIGRTHTATAATNIPEINKAVQTYEGLFSAFPNGWDALTDGTDVVGYLPGGSGFDLNAPVTLTAAQQSNVANAGITTLYKMIKTKAALDTAEQSPTFDPYTGGITAPVALDLTKDKVMTLSTTTTTLSKLGLSATGTYLVVGLGKLNKMVGRTISEPPTHMSDSTNTPGDVYARYGVIFKISDTAAPLMDRAVLVAVVGFHDDGIGGADAHVKEYYNIVKSSQ